MRVQIVLSLIVVCGTPLLAQDPTYANSFGMQFVLIRPGSMQVGVYKPVCPDPNAPQAGRGGVGAQGAAAGAQGPGQTPGPGRAADGPGRGGSGQEGAGRGPGARGPADPRTLWTAADYAACQELVRRESMPGFNVDIKKAYYIGTY